MSLLLPAGGATVTAAPASVSFTSSDSTRSVLSVFTWSGKAIGTAASDRKVVVMVTGTGNTGGAKSVSSLTVGGVSATLVKRNQYSASTSYVLEIWQADVPTGTTGDIVATWNAAMYDCSMVAWAVYGAASAAHATINEEDEVPMNVLITIPANGVCIAGIGWNNNSGESITWTNLTEDADTVGGTNWGGGGASGAFSSLQTNRSITATHNSDQATYILLSAVSWAQA
jgi:hypothetical protein